MPLVPGLSPNLRVTNGGVAGAISPGVSIKHDDSGADNTSDRDDPKAVIRIEHSDGSVTISLDGKSLLPSPDNGPEGWFDNLVDKIDDEELARISDELLRGVDDDLQSRNDWIEERAQGIRLLGLKIELPNVSGSTDGAPVEGMSKVRHPLLQEAVLRFQANARSEMLPTDGPVKIRDDSSSGTELQADAQATALEKDLNHYLTITATEYYPDTDKMFLLLGFGGTAFKKVYNCPLRNRPVSESVDANDLIVNDSCTDLANAKRITHRSMMKPSTVKRMQIIGAYADIDLMTPLQPTLDAAKEEANKQQGVQPSSMRPDDRDREIYEIYCELDLKGYEHKHKGKESGLEIPYRVTIDLSSKKILSITRNYDENTKKLPVARENFVKYVYVPGFGFYDIGLLHILGNTTNASTAGWREMLDAGMFASFPGFLMADTGARQNTNIFRVPPGGGALVKTGGLPINQAIMALPYQPPSQALMQLIDNMVQTGQRVGGTAELPVGEGRADIPVGTILALIEQATKVLNAVHKRMHSAQAQEFRLLVRCFKENPEAFWRSNKSPAAKWDEQTFRAALDNHELTPQADPNTSSYAQRIMKLMALKQLQQQNPSLYDPIAIDTAAIQALGFSNPQQFMAPPEAQAKPPPELLKQQAETQAKSTQAQASMIKAQADAKVADAKSQSLIAEAQGQGLAGGGQVDTEVDKHLADTERMKAETGQATAQHQMTIAQAKAQAELQNADTRAKELHLKTADTALDDARAQEEQHAKAKESAISLAKEVMMKKAEDHRTMAMEGVAHQHERNMQQQDHAHEHRLETVRRDTAVKVAKARPKPAASSKGKSDGK
jgi:hypothetical protein